MRIPPALLPLLPFAAALLFLSLLLRGIGSGELAMPIKGAGLLRLSLADNPWGFYLLAALHLALAALCGWLAWLLLRHGRGTQAPATRSPTAASTATATPDPSTRPTSCRLDIDIVSRGRSGEVVLRLPTGEHRFYWEFGGGNCIAVLNVPDEQAWFKHPALSAHARDPLLRELGECVRERQCPQCRIEFAADHLRFVR